MSHEGSAVNAERLKMIQSIVSRMAAESAQVKTWAAAVLTGLLVLTRVSQNASNALYAVPVFVVLACLDAYYLGVERGYRKFYEAKASEPDGSWTLNAMNEGSRWTGFFVTLTNGLGPTVVFFHGALIAILCVASQLTPQVR